VQQQQLNALDSTIVISNQRLTLAQNRFTIGKLLNCRFKVDLNTDKVTLLRQKELYSNTKTLLNQILERYKTDFKVIDVIVVDPTLLLPELTVLAENKIHNSSL
jgi:hypothetical protein